MWNFDDKSYNELLFLALLNGVLNKRNCVDCRYHRPFTNESGMKRHWRIDQYKIKGDLPINRLLCLVDEGNKNCGKRMAVKSCKFILWFSVWRVRWLNKRKNFNLKRQLIWWFWISYEVRFSWFLNSHVYCVNTLHELTPSACSEVPSWGKITKLLCPNMRKKTV